MVLFEWKKLNSNIQLLDTKKKFFNQYYYNVKYFCPGGRIILHNQNVDLAKAIEIRHQADQRIHNYGGSWRPRNDNAKKISIEQLSAVRDMIDSRPGLKVRVEEPSITFYSANEAVLVEIAEQLSAYAHHIISVTRPASSHVIDYLESGAILIKKDIGYQYKVFCKESMCRNKVAVYNYLTSIGDQVKMSPSVQKNLSRSGDYVWGVWFYTNEPNIASMLNIIEPNFVSNIHRLVVA